MERNDFMNFARDLYFKREFSKNGVSGQEAMRNAILDALGGEFTPTSWGKNKYDVFELISEAVDAVVTFVLLLLVKNRFSKYKIQRLFG